MSFRLILNNKNGAKGLKGLFVAARESALHAVARFWWSDILPVHFTETGRRKYGYDNRTKKHLRKKRRMYGHIQPLVFSGEMRRRMLGKGPVVRVNARGVTMVFHGLPRHTYIKDSTEKVKPLPDWDLDDEKIRNPKALAEWRKNNPDARKERSVLIRRPDKERELTAIDQADGNRLAKMFGREFDQRAKRLGGG